MGTFDIVLLVILGIGAVKGYSQGFIVEVFSFIAFFVGLFLALEFTIPVSMKLFGGSDYLEIISIGVFIVLFILLSMAIKAGAKAIKKAVDITIFGTLDNLAGALAGGLKSAFVISIVFWVLESVGFDFYIDYADDSFIFPYIVHIGPSVFDWLSQLIPVIKDLIDSMEKMSKSSDPYMTLLR